MLLILFQHGFWHTNRIWFELFVQNLWIFQQISNQRNKFNSDEWLLHLFVWWTNWSVRYNQSFYMCYHYGTLLFYEYFLRVTKRNRISLWNCGLHVLSIRLCVSWCFNPQYWKPIYGYFYGFTNFICTSSRKSNHGLYFAFILCAGKKRFSHELTRIKSMLVFWYNERYIFY